MYDDYFKFVTSIKVLISFKNVDQQKQLKLIHEKFKEEINQHIEVCKGAIEGLEAEQIEIKGGLEKRSMGIPLPFGLYIFSLVNYFGFTGF